MFLPFCKSPWAPFPLPPSPRIVSSSRPFNLVFPMSSRALCSALEVHVSIVNPVYFFSFSRLSFSSLPWPFNSSFYLPFLLNFSTTLRLSSFYKFKRGRGGKIRLLFFYKLKKGRGGECISLIGRREEKIKLDFIFLLQPVMFLLPLKPLVPVFFSLKGPCFYLKFFPSPVPPPSAPSIIAHSAHDGTDTPFHPRRQHRGGGRRLTSRRLFAATRVRAR